MLLLSSPLLSFILYLFLCSTACGPPQGRRKRGGFAAARSARAEGAVFGARSAPAARAPLREAQRSSRKGYRCFSQRVAWSLRGDSSGPRLACPGAANGRSCRSGDFLIAL